AGFSPDAGVEFHTRRSMVDECPGGHNDPLLNGRTGVDLGRDWGRARGRTGTIPEARDLASPNSDPGPDRAGDAFGRRPRLVLSAPRNLRTTLDQPQRSAVARR